MARLPGKIALLSTVAGVPGAVLEDVRFAIDGEDHRAFVGVGLVERPDPSPDEFARTAVPS